MSQTDTVILSQADSLDLLTDEEILARSRAQQLDTTSRKPKDRGRDVSLLINVSRQRSQDYTEFSAKPFSANTFVSARFTTPKILTEDYSFGLLGGISFGKWLHQDHAVRLTASFGQWRDNHRGESGSHRGYPVRNISADASYMFNLSSYVGGYRTSRFCEVMLVSGLGYSNVYHRQKYSHALNLHVGANINMRLFRNFDFFIEPLAVVYTNGMAVSYNWRTWLSSVHTTFGLTYNIRQAQSPDSQKLLSRKDGWFITLQAGPQVQNSDIVYENVRLGKSIGIHVGVGLGKYYTDWFAMRYSAAYSRDSWNIYDGIEYPCNYFAIRAEGMVDFVGLIRKAAGKEGNAVFALSLLLGPEAGYMYKVDSDDSPYRVIETAYLGLTGGVQAKFDVTDRLSLFAEPRISLVPYDAPSHNPMSNWYRNYYDCVMNLNFGLQFML